MSLSNHRPFDRLRDRSNRRAELREVKVVIQDLPCVVEDGAIGRPFAPFDRLRDRRDRQNFLQGHILELSADDEFVKVVDISLKMFSMMELQRPGAYHRLKRINRIWQFDKCKHIPNPF